MAITIELYETKEGKFPFSIWLKSLNDSKARAKIRIKLNRLRLGNLGDSKSVGEGVHEIRINYGPGYRLYFGKIDPTVVLLLCGGDKSTQTEDIRKAKSYWNDYNRG
ncbi:MAG TPA: type II toxin-antitoxin system RelE/ParE family toxin [Thiotrichaceae bacterium]|nr:type II toxin-antitoxin system RelE/ParE family toxin [Thiotrichaceae bacterium]